MGRLIHRILPFVFLELVAVCASAQQVWVQSFTGLMPPAKPHGYRYDLAVYPQDIQITFQYDHGGTIDFQISLNGGPFNSGFPCFWNDASGEPGYCFAILPYNCGKVTVRVRQLRLFGSPTSNPVDIYVFNAPFCLPQCDSCQLTDLGQAPGKPVNVATGKLWYRTTELALSGPFGLRFSRWYDNQTSYSRDLGFGWRHNFGAFLDLAQGSNRLIVFRDEEDRVSYFTGLGPGGAVYDDISGSTLSLSEDGTVYTLTTWNNSKYLFDSAGRLTSLVDRIGNTQTIARNPANGFRITSVTDSLGRSLNFGYDASNRITSVNTAPSGLSLGFSYSGTNLSGRQPLFGHHAG